MKVVIVDDEPLARELLRNMLRRHKDVTIVGEFADGAAALDGIREHAPDLVFLDVQMPEASGFDVLRALGSERMPEVIFVTAYDEYALDAFEVHALDYLLKPFDEARLDRALAHARSRIARTLPADSPQRLLELVDRLTAAAPQYARRLAARVGERIVMIPVDDIEWLEAEGKYVRVHGGRAPHLIRETMARLELTLDPTVFRRVSRAAIVNIRKIREVRTWSNGEFVLVLESGAKVPTTRTYRGVIEELVGAR